MNAQSHYSFDPAQGNSPGFQYSNPQPMTAENQHNNVNGQTSDNSTYLHQLHQRDDLFTDNNLDKNKNTINIGIFSVVIPPKTQKFRSAILIIVTLLFLLGIVLS